MLQYNSFSTDIGYNTTMSFTDLNRTFTISPINDTFYYYYRGEKYIKTGNDSLQISDIDGLHLI